MATPLQGKQNGDPKTKNRNKNASRNQHPSNKAPFHFHPLSLATQQTSKKRRTRLAYAKPLLPSYFPFLRTNKLKMKTGKAFDSSIIFSLSPSLSRSTLMDIDIEAKEMRKKKHQNENEKKAQHTLFAIAASPKP